MVANTSSLISEIEITLWLFKWIKEVFLLRMNPYYHFFFIQHLTLYYITRHSNFDENVTKFRKRITCFTCFTIRYEFTLVNGNQYLTMNSGIFLHFNIKECLLFHKCKSLLITRKKYLGFQLYLYSTSEDIFCLYLCIIHVRLYPMIDE